MRAKVEKRWLVEPFEEDSRFVAFPRTSGKCTGCRYCEAICSLSHFKVVSPALSAIRIVRKDIEWLKERAPTIYERRICVQCPGLAPCMAVCPVEGALYRDVETEAVLVDNEKCTKCQLCVKACPYEAIWYNETIDKIIKCDLCGGNPQCVVWCFPRVLRYVKK